VKPIPAQPPEQPESSRTERFEAAYRSLYAPICGYVLRRVSSPEDAAEVVAESFLTLWRRFDDAPTGDALRPWTYGVARRVLGNHRRGERRRGALTERLAADFARIAGRLPDPADDIAARSQFRDAMAQLSEADQELLRLVAWEGLGNDELAVALGVRTGTARLRLHRARRRLQAALGDAPVGKHDAAAGQVREQRETTTHSRVAEGAS
jgi:RNA polymerase sigma-70 factor (ECF subfamily)